MVRPRLIRFALWLWPVDLRARHGRSLELTAVASWNAAGRLARPARVWHRTQLIGDLLRSGLAEQWNSRNDAVKTWRSAWSDVLRDARLAVRSLRRQPGYALVAVLTLALGVGANTAMFSVANPVLLRPLPYPDADRLVAIVPARRENPATPLRTSYATYKDWQESARSLDPLAAYGTAGSTYRGPNGSSIVVTTAVTGNLFRVLQSLPARGRVLGPADDVPGAPSVVVVSEAFWRAALESRDDAIGRTLDLDGGPYTIVGVMPAAFTFPHTAPPTDVWVPVTHFRPFAALLEVRGAPFLDVLGRLASGETPAQAQSEITTIASTLAGTHASTDGDTVARVIAFKDQVLGDSRATLIMLATAVVVLLFIACANVASLQLTRTSHRLRELAVRAALGASRGRLMIQVIVEGLVLAIIGGAAGLLVGYAGLGLLRGLLGTDLPPVREIGIDRAVLFFTFAVACLTGILFAAIPAVVSTGADLQARVKAGGRGATLDRRQSRTHGGLVVAEIALALVLLTDAGLLVRSLGRLHHVQTGFIEANISTATVMLPQASYGQPAQWRSFAEDLSARLRDQPGVDAVSVGVGVPMTGPAVRVPVAVAGMPVGGAVTRPTADLIEVGTMYFQTLGIPLLRGRTFADTDRDTTPAVGVVNDAFVRRFLDPTRDPVGQRVTVGTAAALEVVGVVGDTAQSSISAPPPPALYLAFAQRPFWVMTFAIRTRHAGLPIADVFRRQVAALAPSAPVVSVDSLETLVDRATAPSSHRTLVVGLLAALALLLAGVGIYGVVGYSVARRTREVGVRLALGADPSAVRRLVLMQGTKLAVLGIGLGVLVSRVTMPLVSTLLFQVTTTDGVTLLAVPAALGLTAIAACYIPARRATRIDPIVALRSE